MRRIKQKTAILLAALMLFAFSLQTSAEVFTKPENENWISDTDGSVVLKGTLDLPEGTPVTVMAAPQKMDAGEDVTAKKIEGADTPAKLLSLVDYIETIELGADKKLNISFTLNDEFPTGNGVILIGYDGGDGLINIGSFEHVGKQDVKNVLKSFNENTADKYNEIIKSDMAGSEVLRKIAANTAGYSKLTAKEDFANILYELKPESGFDSESLVGGFNEAVAWITLREADTLETLKAYNETYWNLPVGEEDDLFTLSKDEQAKVLWAIKNGKYKDADIMLDDFSESVALAMFRELTERDSLEELLESEKYGKYFESAKEILDDSGLNEYYLMVAKNYIVEENASCDSLEDINDLFYDAIDAAEDERKSENKSSGGSSGGGSSKGANVRLPESVSQAPVIPTTPVSSLEKEASKHPFSDIAKGHWAEEYIADMYQKGIISGISADSFGADLKISRQDFVKIIVSALGLDLSDSGHGFSDVEKGAYYEPYVVTAVENGIISGISKDSFGLGEIKREDAAVIMARILDLKKIEADGETKTFEDGESISEYAKEAAEKVVKSGLITGDENGCFNPSKSLGRAEACAIISRLLKTING